MKFGNYQYIWLLFLIPAIAIFYYWGFKRKYYLIEKFVVPELKDRLLKGVSFGRQKFKAFLLVLVVVFALLALIRPKWGFHWEEVKRRGVDIIIALDVSKSMLAQDVSPNRLERAKRKIIDFLNIVQGDRVGLIAFAGTSFLQAPLTLDYGAVQIFLDDLDTDLIPIPGTAIEDAIIKAIGSFDLKDKKSRVLILITDGEDHNGNPVEAAKNAKKEGVKIYTIGIGQKDGAPIPNGKDGGFKKNSSGEMVLTHLDEETLQKVALETGGSYVRSVSGDLDLEQIYKDIQSKIQDKELKSGRQKRFEERFQWPLVIALFLLLFESLFPERRRRSRKKDILVDFQNKKNIFIIFFIILSSLLLSNYFILDSALASNIARRGIDKYHDGKYDEALKDFVDAQIEDPKNSLLKYDMANTYYKMGQYDKAQKLFESLSTDLDPKIAFKSFYNLGNTYYRQGKLRESVENYKQALKLEPNDKDAKFNLDFVRKEIKRRLEEQKKQQQKRQQQNNKSCNNKKQDQQQKKQDQQQKKQDQQQKKQDQQQKKQDQQQKKQDQQQEKQDQQQKKQDQKKKEQEKKQADAQKDRKQESKPKRASAAQRDKKKDEKRKLDKQEAQRWLSRLKENRKKYLKKKLQGRGSRYQVEKDW